MKVPYSKYKSTDVPWLPEVPENWDLVKAKFLFKERGQKGFENEPLLAATQTQGVIPKSMYENTTVTAQKDFHLLKLVEVEDFVISLRSFQGGIEYAYYRGIISPAYTIFYRKNENQINNQYFKYLFKSQPFINSLTLFVTGIREGQNIDYTEFKNSFLPLPTLEEQTSIANYLDSQNEKINLFISKKQKLIELLEEQKQSIINEVIVKGLSTKVKMKPSGVDWLGEIPQSWEVKKLRFVGRCQNGMNKDQEFFGSGFPFVTYGDVYKNDSLPNTLTGLAQSSEADRETYSVLEGDVFFTRTSETIDEIGFAGACLKTIPNATFSGFLIRFRPNRNSGLYPGFSKYYFRSELHRRFFAKEMNLVTRASLGQNLLKNLPVLIPPLQEQKEIEEYINSESKRIDEAISRIEKEIELIKEYKQSLIAEVVTGKIDIRKTRVIQYKPKEAELLLAAEDDTNKPK